VFGFQVSLRRLRGCGGQAGVALSRARPDMVEFGSGQGLSDFAIPHGAGHIVRLLRGLQKSENAALGPKMPFPDGH